MIELGKSRRLSPKLALALLTAISTIGFIDRIILNVLVEPIKAEFHLSDTQMGLVGGLAFAVLNVALGLYVARIAERQRRLTLVAIGTLLWSIATALCGMAGNFIQLVLARIGVGVGEAVGLPSSSSIISDYFPRHKRATALSVLLLAPPLGAFLGSAGGALVAQAHGWRMAFFIAAIPGILLALAIHWLVAEPVRGQHDGLEGDDSVPPMTQVIARIWQRHSLRHLLIGSSIAAMVGFGLNAFLAAFLARRFGFSLVEAGVTAGMIASLPAALSVVGAGWLCDRLAVRDARIYALLPAGTLLLAAPLYAFAISRDSVALVIGLIGLCALVQYCYLGPTSGVFQNMMHPRMRATSAAFTSMVYALVGSGLGPLFIGVMSDHFSPKALLPGVGLGQAMAVAALLYVWAAAHYLLASRSIRAEMALKL
jgi:MFS family permease